MKRLLVLTVVMAVAAAATGCSLFNRNNACEPCLTGMSDMGCTGVATSGGYTSGGSYPAAPVVTDGGYLPTPN
jgi:hypothetical protein